MSLRRSKTQVAEGIGKNVRAIAQIEQQALRHRSLGERCADLIAAYAGSATCAVIHVAIFSMWILVNMEVVPGLPAFDPYPFSFLTFVVSLEAIFLSIFVLISQNRLAREADMRGHVDLQVNLLAEQETTTMLRLLTRVCDHLGIPHETTDQDRALARNTDVKEIMSKLRDSLPAPPSVENGAGSRKPRPKRT